MNISFRFIMRSLLNFSNIDVKKGHPRLIRTLSNLYSKLINREIHPSNEILVTTGATEALYSAIQG